VGLLDWSVFWLGFCLGLFCLIVVVLMLFVLFDSFVRFVVFVSCFGWWDVYFGFVLCFEFVKVVIIWFLLFFRGWVWIGLFGFWLDLEVDTFLVVCV